MVCLHQGKQYFPAEEQYYQYAPSPSESANNNVWRVKINGLEYKRAKYPMKLEKIPSVHKSEMDVALT